MSWSLSPFDPTEDWDLWDGKETVSYERYKPATKTTPEGYYSILGGMKALVRSLREQVGVILENGENVTVNTRIHMPSAAFNFVPHRNDRITRNPGGAEKYFYVYNIDTATLGTRFMFDCYKGAK